MNEQKINDFVIDVDNDMMHHLSKMMFRCGNSPSTESIESVASRHLVRPSQCGGKRSARLVCNETHTSMFSVCQAFC